MSYRDTEKALQIKSKVLGNFSSTAISSGTYGKNTYDFCLNNKYSFENIFEGFRADAIYYFLKRGITWHSGIKQNQHYHPENHLCSSQISCINHLFYFIDKPELLKRLLLSLGLDVSEMLPINLDLNLYDYYKGSKQPFLAFEWIGNDNYLKELYRGKIAPNNIRTRGANFTSADFIIRYRDSQKKIQILLGEWKYTEYYSSSFKRYGKSHSKTDRYEKIYKSFLNDPACPIKMFPGISHDDLFYDPFDQLMRLQLLAQEMQTKKEMDADNVFVFLVVPQKNVEYLNKITSKNLQKIGKSVPDVWTKITGVDKFKYIYSEDLLSNILSISIDSYFNNYLKKRYKR